MSGVTNVRAGMPPPSAQRVAALDGLRGLAILLVLFAHLTVILPGDGQWLVNTAGIGWIGVDLFFVLSGFLITGILVDSVGKAGWRKHFYARRAARILPLYYAITFFSFVVLPHIPIPHVGRFGAVGNDQIWYWLMLPNVPIAAHGIFRHGIMDVSWSVAIEEHFYLLWPFVLTVLRPGARLPFTISTIVASGTLRLALFAAGANLNSLYVATPTHLDGIAAGCALALLIREPGHGDRALKKLARVLLLTGMACMGCLISAGYALRLFRDTNYGFTSYFYNPLLGLFGFTAAAAMASGLLLIVWTGRGQGGLLNRLFGSAFMRLFGRYSYCLYFTNLPIRGAIRDLALKPTSFAAWPGGALVAQGVFYVVATVACLLFAMASWRFFERPFLRLVPGHAAARAPVGFGRAGSATRVVS